MKKFIKYYENPFEKDINMDLMNKTHDGELIQYIVECAKSLEILPNIKFVDYSFEDMPHKIDFNDLYKTRVKLTSSEKKDRNKNRRPMDILENRLGELTLKWHLTCKGVEKDVVKKLMVPLPDENGYFTIKGNKYLLVYQLLEASTYVSKNTVSLKSLQAVALDRVAKQYKAMNGLTYTCPIFNLQMFKNPVLSLLFYLANFGFKNTLTFFNVNDSIRIICVGDDMDTKLCKENNIDHVKSLNDIDDLYEERKYIYFPISKKILIRVNSKIFHKYNYVQSIVGMLKELTTNRLTLEELCDRDFWLEKLDYINSKNAKKMDLNNTSSDKGLSTLIHFSRMLDETNKKNLKLNLYHRENIYSIVRWLITEYDNLKLKDNMDLDNKRIRCHEYITSMLTNHFSEKLSRAINLGKKAEIGDIEQIFKFQPDLLLIQLYASGILPFDDRTSDMDFFRKFEFTTKGPNSLGNKNSKNIAKKFRGIDPSDIGRKDINVCGNSDPGRSGTLTPFCKTYKLFFTDDMEPQNTMLEYNQDIAEEYPDYLHISIGDTEDEKNNTKIINGIMNSINKMSINEG